MIDPKSEVGYNVCKNCKYLSINRKRNTIILKLLPQGTIIYRDICSTWAGPYYLSNEKPSGYMCITHEEI